MLLLEVGLGGRFDATNVIDEPAAAVITSIGHDHAEYLGDTSTKIAGEKAGIFKRGCPAVIAPQDTRRPIAVLRGEAEAIGATPLLVGAQDFSVHEERGRLVYQDEDGLLDLPRAEARRPAPVHQRRDGHRGAPRGRVRRLDTAAFEAGMTRADWPARLQRLTAGRLAALAPAGCELWLDGGHNPDGGRVLADRHGGSERAHRAPLVLIAGMLSTKDPSGFFQPLRRARPAR